MVEGFPAQLNMESKTISLTGGLRRTGSTVSRGSGRGSWILPLIGELLLTDRLWEEEPPSQVVYPFTVKTPPPQLQWIFPVPWPHRPTEQTLRDTEETKRHECRKGISKEEAGGTGKGGAERESNCDVVHTCMKQPKNILKTSTPYVYSLAFFIVFLF